MSKKTYPNGGKPKGKKGSQDEDTVDAGKAPDGFEDKEQGNLFFTLADIIDYHRPTAFVLENVKNLRSHDQGRTFQVIREKLELLKN